MTPEHVEAARKALMDSHPCCRTTDDVVATLDRAGLLRTGLEKRAVEACEQRAAWPTTFIGDREEFRLARIASETVIAVGRESLALKQPPKPRWTKEMTGKSGQHYSWRFYEDRLCAGARYMDLSYATEAHADSFLAALNACDTEPTNA